MIYTVGEAAKQLNVAPSTLRYYDKEGLLPFLERSGSGIRMFRDEDMSWLKMIDCLKKTGMPIKEIKHFMDCCTEGDSTINERLSIITAQHQAVIKQMAELQEMLDMLSFKCWYYETAKAAGTCAVFDTMDLNDAPKHFQKFIDPANKHI